MTKSGSSFVDDDESPPTADLASDAGRGSTREFPVLAPGFIGVLGLELVKAGADEVEAELLLDERHLQPHGVVHGGVYCSVVETCCSIGAQRAAPPGMNVVGVDNHTSFVRAVKDGRLLARAKPLHVGRRAQLWECVIEDSARRLVATGRLRLMSVSAPGSERDSS